jgi:DNA-binding NtrC family response regulator
MQKKTILCVDDEKIVLDSLKSQLKRNFSGQFNYELASGAEEAMEIINELNEDGNTILIIVSDWLMPGIKGDEFLIKVHEMYPEIITFMLTGHSDQRSIDNAYKNANLRCCISKPWKEDELFDAIRIGLEEVNV